MPPEIVTGVNAVAALFMVSALVATLCVEVNAGLTVRLKVFVATAYLLSVTVTVKVVAVNAAVAVPEMAPDEVLNDSPVGRPAEIP